MTTPHLIIDALKRQQFMKRCRFDIRSTAKHPTKLIIGIGQIHPVHSGKHSRATARKIGTVQAWIFDTCSYLYDKCAVRSFGQEGFSGKAGALLQARLPQSIVSELSRSVAANMSAQSILLREADNWHMALKLHNQKEIEQTTATLNGLALLQAVHSDVTMFPIEQKDVHGVIGEGIAKLQTVIAKIESSKEYQAVQYKKGKGLTKDEYNAAMQRNALVKEFNRALKHRERNRSIFREVVEHSEVSDITVFILGQAHRSGINTLAKKYLPNDTLYVWISPKELWWWKAMKARTFWAVLLTSVLILGFYAF